MLLKIMHCPEKILPMNETAAILPPFSISSDGQKLFFLDKCVDRMNITDPKIKRRVPPLYHLVRNICMDQPTVEIVYKVLSNYIRRKNPLLEGVTGAAKTLGFTLSSAAVGAPLWKINYSNRTSTADIIGRFVPNAAIEQRRLYEILHASDITVYRPETQAILSKYRYRKDNAVYSKTVSALDIRQIIDLENLQISEKPFTFVKGPMPEAAFWGGWLLHDEANTSPMKIRSALNSPLERKRAIRIPELGISMSINGKGKEKVDPRFFQGIAQNDLTYAGRKEDSPDLRRRVRKYTIKSPTQQQINEMISFLISGVNPVVKFKKTTYQAAAVEPLLPQLAKEKDHQQYFVYYSRFHHAMQTLCETDVLCRNRKQKLVYTRRDISAFLDFLAKFESYNRASGETTNFQNNPTETFLRAIDLFYTNRFVLDEEDRQRVAELKLTTIGAVDKECYLEEAFGKDIAAIKGLFVNPYSDNLVFKPNADELLAKMTFPGTKVTTLNLKTGKQEKKAAADFLEDLLNKTREAKEDPKKASSQTAAEYYVSQDKKHPRMIDQYTRPVVEYSPDGKYLYIHDQRIEVRKDVKPEHLKYIPRIEDCSNLCMDVKTVKLLTNMAIGLKHDIAILVEGLPATTKTAGAEFMGAYLKWPTHKVNYNGQTDAMSIIGQYVPSDETLAEVYTRIIMGDADQVVSESTAKMVRQAKEEQRALSMEEAQQIAAWENLEVPSSSWKFLEKEYLMAMRYGHLVIQDEVNQAGSDALERTNSYADNPRNFTLTEHTGERLSRDDGTMHADSRVLGTCNPAEYPGKQVLSPAGINRYPLYLQINNVTDTELDQMLSYLIYGTQPELEVNGIKYSAQTQTSNYPKLSRLNKSKEFLTALATFHYKLTEAVNPVMKKRTIAKNDPNLLITRSDLVDVLDSLEKEELTTRVKKGIKVSIETIDVLGSKTDRKSIITSILEETYLEKFSDEKPKGSSALSDREQVRTMLEAAGLTEDNWQFDEIEPLITGQVAVKLINGKFSGDIQPYSGYAKAVNTNPADLEEWKSVSADITQRIRELTDISNRVIQEAHRYQVEKEQGIMDLQASIEAARKAFEEKANNLNAMKDRLADGALDHLARVLDEASSKLTLDDF